MDLSRKTKEEDANQVLLGQEYPANIYKKRKTFLSHINSYDEFPYGQRGITNTVSSENDNNYSSKPVFERERTSDTVNFSQSVFPNTEHSKNYILEPSRNSCKNITSRTGIWAAALPSDTESTPSEKGEDDQDINPVDTCNEKNMQAHDISNEKEEQSSVPLDTDKENDRQDHDICKEKKEQSAVKEEEQGSVVKGTENYREIDDLLFDEVTRDFINSVSSSASSDEDSDAGNEWFPCSTCKRVFFARKTFTNHRRSCFVEKEQRCPCCGKTFTKMCNMKNHIIAVHTNERSFLCDICGMTYPHRKALRMHIATHDSSFKTHTCEVCGKSFTQSSYLKSHALIHSDEKPFKCEQCGQTFRRAFTLRCHMKTHTNERPYKCECGKSFTQSSSLKTHQKLHSGEKPHVCNVCCKGFILKAALQLHMRTHTMERPFECEICKKTFSQSSTLKIHLKTHKKDKTGLEKEMPRHELCTNEDTVQDGEAPTEGKTKVNHCEKCDRFFATKHTLKVHLMRHSGERPYKCGECSKTFTQSSTLKTHMRTHTGDKPYACDVCDTHFTYSYALQKHHIKHIEAGEMKIEEAGEMKIEEAGEMKIEEAGEMKIKETGEMKIEEAGEMTIEEEVLEQDDKHDIVKFNTNGEESVADKAPVEGMKETILQTLCTTDDT